jgi:V/A-type H+-transporting ATPase subunit A
MHSMAAPRSSAEPARVTVVRENLVRIRATGPVTRNEVAWVHLGDRRLMAEVLRVEGEHADLQVYEPTDGVTVGARVELSGELLSVELGPGLLGRVFDGLQNPLRALAERDGFFLRRGAYLPAIDRSSQWSFTAAVTEGQRLEPGEALGEVQEGRFPHRILVPWDLAGPVTVEWIQQGTLPVESPLARLRDEHGEVQEVGMLRRAPIRRPLPERLLARRRARRAFPRELLPTTLRIVDTFFPVAKGGTACIPGPFGAGKTVLQNLIASYSAADIVIIIACGERAGEVVDTITEFPHMSDPHTGGSLMDRTIIIANTSSMPVAARESSIYTGITLGEYYRQMGFDVLTIADSTSRWAQAMRETSGRMEEIPGEEAFPAYLDSSIKALYERAGVIENPDGSVGSLTLIGTVSPAGGNFQEPVTQATLSTVKTFLGLSADRAYKRYYPAVDPLISWSRYLDQLAPWFREHLSEHWSEDVAAMLRLLKAGDRIHQLVQVTGEEGITLEDYVTWQKAQLVDLVYLQQDAFDPVDVSMPLERQRTSFYRLKDLVDRSYRFEGKDAARDFFARLTSLYRNLHYSRPGSNDYQGYVDAIAELADGHTAAPD